MVSLPQAFYNSLLTKAEKTAGLPLRQLPARLAVKIGAGL